MDHVPMIDRLLGAVMHIGNFPTIGLLPLGIWLARRNASPHIDRHGREALNLFISHVIYIIGLGCIFLLMVIGFVGIILAPVFLFVLFPSLIVVILYTSVRYTFSSLNASAYHSSYLYRYL